MKKNLIAWVLSIGMAASLAACTPANPTPSTANPSQNKEEHSTESDLSFPEKPIEIICPWGVGGAVDLLARNIATVADKYMDQPIAVVNVTGAGGTLAATQYLQEKPDGYKLLIMAVPVIAFQPHVREVSYSWSDFSPIIGLNEQKFFLLSNPSKSGIENLEDLKKAAGERKVTIGNAGAGTSDYVYPKMLFKEMGIEVEDVVYDGAVEAQNALLGGHLDLSVGILGNFEEQVKAGNLKILGTFSENEEELKDIGKVPSLSEQGYPVVGSNSYFIVGREGTPQEVIDKLNKVFNEVFADPDFKEYGEKMGLIMNPMSPEELDAFIEEKIDGANEVFQ